jgi:ankyrin repeat protein
VVSSSRYVETNEKGRDVCLSSNRFQESLKNVLNLQWIVLGELQIDEEALELLIVYDDLLDKKTSGKFKADNREQLLAVESTLRKAVEASRILKLPTRPSHKTMSVYMKSDLSDEALLIKLIEGVTKLDEFHWLRNNANNLLKQGGYLVDNQGLMDRCLRPCLLLTRRMDVPEYADTRFCDSIAFLEADLQAWVESLEVQKLFPLADAVKKLAQYYARTRETFRQIGYSAAIVPPNMMTLASHLASPRTIDTTIMQSLLTGPKEGHGLAHVTKKHGVYWKQNPSHPGVEFATDSISALVATRATCAACLVKFSYIDENKKNKQNLVLASKAVWGKTLRETLQTSPDDIASIDMESFSEIFIISLLTCPQDWKSDNLIVSKADGKTTIVGIDNDHSFADPVVAVKDGSKHTINVKNILFCLPQCNKPIHPNTREKMLQIDPLLILVKWIQALNKQNSLYQSLLDEKFLSILDLKQLNLPIRLRHGTLLEAHRVLSEIQSVLRSSENVTLNFLFQRVYPMLYHFYDHFNRRKRDETSIEAHFNSTIWATPQFEDIPELMDMVIRIKGEDAMMREALKSCTQKVWDMFKGDRMPIEELETLLREVDWSNSSAQAQIDMISIMKKLSFMNLTVIGSSELTGGDLAALTDASPGLLQIQLFRCPKISKDALNHGIFRTRNIALYLSACPISQAEAVQLAQLGFHISLRSETEVPDQEPRGSMALEAPNLFHALEAIRSGRYSEACDFLTDAGSGPSELLQKYRSRILQNLVLPDLMRSKHAQLLGLLVRTLNWNINEPTMTGQRPWHLVTQVGDVTWARNVVAICPGLSINCQNANLETCLHLAVQEGDVPMLTYLLEELHCDPAICDNKMRTALTLVLRLSTISTDTKTSMAKLLIDNSKDINEWRDSLQNTYLHIALRLRLLTVAARLIASGTNVNSENLNGESPLHLACSSRCRDIGPNGFFRNMVSVLLDAGANAMARNKNGQTAMHYAIRGGSRTIISTLAAHDPRLLSTPDSHGYTPLHTACESTAAAFANSLRELLEGLKYPQLDLNPKSSLGVTPLILAAQKSNWLAIELLCEAEATQVDLEDSANNTALFYAVTRTCLPAVQILLQKRGSNPNKGSGGVSPMWRAVLVLYKDLMGEAANRQSSWIPQTASTSSPASSATASSSSTSSSSFPSLVTLPNLSAQTASSVLLESYAEPALSPRDRSPSPLESRSAANSGLPRSSSPTPASAPALDYSGKTPLVPPASTTGIRHDIAASLFHYGGDVESPNKVGSYLIHEIALRSLKDPLGITGPAEFEFIFQNAPHAIHKFNRNEESFLHLLARLIPGTSPAPLVTTIRKLWRRYLSVVGASLTPAFFEKETTDGSGSLIHMLIQSSNDVLLEDLATGGLNVLARLKFNFEASKICKKHPVMCALEIGNLAVCSLMFEHFTFSLSRSEWKQLFLVAMKVGCLDMAKNAQLRCQPGKA